MFFKAPYLPHGSANVKAYADFLGLNFASFFLEHVCKLKLRARKGCPVIEKEILPQLPIIIFSHGLGGTSTSNSFLCEDFASKGYVVFSMGHGAGMASLAMNSNGAIIHHRKLTKEQREDDSKLWDLRNAQVEHRGYEIQLLLDTLEELQEGNICPPLKGRLSLENVFICGHSYGGATAIHTSLEDWRIKACCAHDPIMYPFRPTVLKKANFVQPLFVIDSEEWASFDDRPGIVTKLMQNCSKEQFEEFDSLIRSWIYVKNTGHYNFCDFPIFLNAALRRLGKSGAIEPVMSLRIISDLTTNFFDQYCTVDLAQAACTQNETKNADMDYTLPKAPAARKQFELEKQTSERIFHSKQLNGSYSLKEHIEMIPF